MSTTTTTASDSGGVERSPGGNRRKIILSAADTEATVQKLTAELQAACAAGESTRIAELSTQLAQMAVPCTDGYRTQMRYRMRGLQVWFG